MYIAILGRQPELGIAELEKVFGSKAITVLSADSVQIDADNFDVQRFGGVMKAGKIVAELPVCDWRQISQRLIRHYVDKWSSADMKITLGISAYGFPIGARDVQKTGIILKQKLKKYSTSIRLVPNLEPALSTAVSHHNKLGLSENKIELLIVRTKNNRAIIAESTGAQNITAYAKRDQERPKRDAFVGMLPPKLAQIMINLAVGNPPDYNDGRKKYSERIETRRPSAQTSRSAVVSNSTLEPGSELAPGASSDPERSSAMKNDSRKGEQKELTILDPFCGTGVVLQEALLMGYSVVGTDLSEKMIDFSRQNLDWLSKKYQNIPKWQLDQGDAMTAKWQRPIDAVVGETYLGQPFSAPPSPAKLSEVVKNCDHIISEFLKNLAPQIETGTPVCIAVPAWRDQNGNFTHLPLASSIARLGYKPHEFTHLPQTNLLYYRPDQIVARELLVITKK